MNKLKNRVSLLILGASISALAPIQILNAMDNASALTAQSGTASAAGASGLPAHSGGAHASHAKSDVAFPTMVKIDVPWAPNWLKEGGVFSLNVLDQNGEKVSKELEKIKEKLPKTKHPWEPNSEETVAVHLLQLQGQELRSNLWNAIYSFIKLKKELSHTLPLRPELLSIIAAYDDSLHPELVVENAILDDNHSDRNYIAALYEVMPRFKEPIKLYLNGVTKTFDRLLINHIVNSCYKNKESQPGAIKWPHTPEFLRYLEGRKDLSKTDKTEKIDIEYRPVPIKRDRVICNKCGVELGDFNNFPKAANGKTVKECQSFLVDMYHKAGCPKLNESIPAGIDPVYLIANRLNIALPKLDLNLPANESGKLWMQLHSANGQMPRLLLITEFFDGVRRRIM